ncbi:hypothetical protein BKN38_05985 [Helicobacter sp. CLO-3]|uniref:M23 family metallopeptidase n=1 Tax=unclassified Helicobacter TaxID=2593540 RepID=UPI0008057996|nr:MULTISPECIES: M23 family metallopeptidase [unclassified Helicobacter]OBV29482.1 hypothetical protein BA723_05385 [Helicobacter sp. CLO-3]OHU83084.1 hypothetical protein BKN38_05985 [Helicobacter sp. CLO-3]
MFWDSKLLNFLTIVAVVLFGYFLYTLDLFKAEPIEVEVSLYVNPTTQFPIDDKAAWNPERRIAINAKSENRIKSYKIKATTEDGLVVLEKEEVIVNRPKTLKIWLPKPDINLPDKTRIHYDVAITDWSNANFFSGATLHKKLDFIINTKPPTIKILANSHKISYGGSALVVFSVDSVDIKEIQVSNGKDSFIPFPFMREGYYAVIMAWPIANQNFSGKITATDTALNTQRIAIPFIKDTTPRYQSSTIALKEDFLSEKMDSLIDDILDIYPDAALLALNNNFEKFVYINEQVRENDEKTIKEISQEASEKDAQSLSMPVSWTSFTPIKGYAVVGKFGDKRTYINDKNQVSHSVHLGLDMASVKNDNIIAQNPARVALAKKLGVYGNTIILDHGFGVISLYSHLEKFLTSVDSSVESKDVIGLSGQSGWAFGDHLHFGMLVQGHNVRNVEWMDSCWIKNNITDIFEKARVIIESK